MPHQFKILEKEIIVKLIKLQKETGQMFDWSKYTFDSFSFGSSINEFPGLELPYKNSFVGAKLLRATFTHTDFTRLNLMGISSNKSYFSNSYFNGTNLNNSEFIETDFREDYLPSAKFKDAVLHVSDFFMADLSNADLRSADLKGARLDGAIIDGAYFNGADITDIDLNGEEFSGSEIFDLIIKNRVIDYEERMDILSGNLQKYF